MKSSHVCPSVVIVAVGLSSHFDASIETVEDAPGFDAAEAENSTPFPSV